MESLERERVEQNNQLNSLREKLSEAEETIKHLTAACVRLFLFTFELVLRFFFDIVILAFSSTAI